MHVGFFAVHCGVEAFALVVGVARSGMHRADDLQQDEAHDAAVDDRRADGCRLDAELAGVAVEQAVGQAVQALSAKTPVRSAPTVPPTPCAATTSSESSRLVFARQIRPK